MSESCMSLIVPETSKNINHAARIIQAGGIIGYLTDTLYGIGCDATNDQAVSKVYDIKYRSEKKPILVLTDKLEKALDIGIFNELAITIAKAFWPGPLTLVLPRAERCSLVEGINMIDDTVSIRIPSRINTLKLIHAAGSPLTAPSANLTGDTPANSSEDVVKTFGKNLELVLDGGQETNSIPSTIVDVTTPTLKIIRKGAINHQDIEKLKN